MQLHSVVGNDLSGRAALGQLEAEGMSTGGIEVLPHPSRTAQYVAINNINKDLTLAMADPPYWGLAEVAKFAQAEPVGPRTFMAEYFHLYAFQSEDWAGEWWHTMSWEWLHSWRLQG